MGIKSPDRKRELKVQIKIGKSSYFEAFLENMNFILQALLQIRYVHFKTLDQNVLYAKCALCVVCKYLEY